MTRLEARVKRLEAAVPNDDGPGLSGVFRTALDDNDNVIGWDCLLDPVAPPKIPQLSALEVTDASGSTSRRRTIASYIDQPWRMTRAQTATWMRLLSNRSRSVHQIPFTSEQADEWRCFWNDVLTGVAN